MSVLPVGMGSSGADVGDIGHSVRLRAAASAYFSRTFGAGNRRLWSYGGWLKCGDVSGAAQMELLSVRSADSDTGYLTFKFNTDRTLYVDGYGTSWRRTSQVFRDPTAHFHFWLIWDSENATANDRIRLYVNGQRVTSFSITNNPSTGTDYAGNQASEHNIGRNVRNANAFLDGVLSDLYFFGGAAVDPSAVVETNSDGVCVPKAYAGSYSGTNSCHLDFADIALTSGSNAGLGKDTSGNGNYWNTNNISVTAGVTYDSMVDTPTNNYATLNPLDLVSGGTAYVTSGANLDITTAATYAARSTIWPTSGKVWAEYTMTSSGTANGTVLGVGRVDANIASGTGTYTTYRMNGNKEVNGTGSAYGATFTNTDVIGIAWDVSAGTIEFYKQTSGSGSFTSQGQLTGISTAGDVTLLCRTANSGSWNFGQRPFNNSSIPSGYVGLCTANLPAVAITNPKKHFNAKTRTGTAATFSVTGELFQPGMVWTKGRSGATDHAIYDAVRGVEKRLETNNTDAEVTGDTTGLTAFNSDGFTGGALAQINTNSATYIDWMWKANGAGSSNTDGSRTSTVSANITAGFSIASFNTGAAANVTVGHGLSVVPSMIILKNRSTQEWNVWHKNLTNTQDRFLILNASNGEGTAVRMWANTAPTSSVFSIESGYTIAASTDAIAYNFAEVPGYSKIGSYTGNGSADGPFVWCGFRPKWVLFKRVDSADNWIIFDAARAEYNATQMQVYPNLTNAEDSGRTIDLLSNGFKIRDASPGINGTAMVFAAFAEHPYGGSNVAPSPAR